MTEDPRLMLEVRESFAYYEGMITGLPKLMVGKLTLTKEYITFHQYEVEKVGLLERPRLKQTKNIIFIPLDRIVSVTVQQGIRAVRSKPNWKNPDDFVRKSNGERQLNMKPRLLDSSEKYSRLVLTVESEYGVDMAYFELEEPSKWATMIASRIKKQSV
jgi:hypothetical protein